MQLRLWDEAKGMLQEILDTCSPHQTGGWATASKSNESCAIICEQSEGFALFLVLTVI